MTDRVPGAPGQYQAVISQEDLIKMQNNEPFVITMTRDDKPITEGTPYNKASVLPDELAAVLCPEIEDPTPADALRGLFNTKAPAVESEEYPGCYYRIVDGEVEWINPPMTPGKEYRTAERYLGGPVYVQLVDLGTLPNDANKDVNVGVYPQNLISIAGRAVFTSKDDSTVVSSRAFPECIYSWIDTNCELRQDGVFTFYTMQNLSEWTAKFVMRYLKAVG